MAFVKLDCGILNSTLWVEREPRDVFITALLMAEPRELLEPMEQFKVSALEKTGFVVPPGWYGFVQAAGPGIVRRAMADPVAGMQALEKLGSPDPESRSSDFDGRRLVRVDGGYVVLNYMKYRDKDATSAARSARYRERKKVGSVTRDSSTVTRDSSRGVTIAEAEANGEAEAEAHAGIGKAARADEQAQIQQQQQSAQAVAPTRAGQACLRMKAAGLQAVSPSHPKLLALLEAGVADDELAEAAADAVERGKGFAYALATAEGRRRDAAATPAIPAAPQTAARDNGDFERLKADQEALAARTPEQIEASRRVREAAMAAVKRATSPKTTTKQPKEGAGS